MKRNNLEISILVGIAVITALIAHSSITLLGEALAAGTTLSPVAYMPFIASGFDGLPTPTATSTPVIPRADLIVVSLIYTDTHTLVGEPVHFQMTVKNQGDAVAQNFDVAWNPLGADHSTAWMTVAADADLNPDEDETIQWEYTWEDIAEFTTVGMVDYGNEIAESDETNNTQELYVFPGEF